MLGYEEISLGKCVKNPSSAWLWVALMTATITIPVVAQPAVQLSPKQREELTKQVRSALTNPAKVDLGPSPIKGPKNAPITLVEFADFQCPACNQARSAFINPLMKRYPGKIRLVFKNFPLVNAHEYAMSAAKAGWAATQQGKFYEFYEALYDRQKDLNEKTIVEVARAIKLDETRFNRDRQSSQADEQIKKDMEQGKNINLQGTPTFVLNGLVLGSGTPLEVIDVIVEVLKKDKGLKV
jgi:protein-disulfide isomerase